ncbi:MAG: L-serine ammonia-lyase, partial [Steroidobacteraceae bacterium]|nr:L-serine ammonia-lyase [Steroidobacteraceae bacterium]MDW8259166.1 L-serine ammonia-lyase [Gammaproteobacteria bacterium]
MARSSALSVFDIFKIGIGPSSSHTMGPMRAARLFAEELQRRGLLERVATVVVRLYGSLALTGKGHGTDRAILLGLEGAEPETVDPDTIDARVATIRATRRLHLLGRHAIEFDEPMQLLFLQQERLAYHPNGMRCDAFAAGGERLLDAEYYSVGGGFVVGAGGTPLATATARAPPRWPFTSASELLALCRERRMSIHELVLANECVWQDASAVETGLDAIWAAMQACVERGFRQRGVLPGGLQVRRRAPLLYQVLSGRATDQPLAAMDWVNAYALAVNEENAAGGRVVTAPTNGAAGVIPAVLHYYRRFES